LTESQSLLAHRISAVAADIHRVSRAAYTHEANLLGVTEFPPLEETTIDIRRSNNQFFGIHDGDLLVALIELEQEGDYLLIARLVVTPEYHRRGLASRLVKGIVDARVKSVRVTTATGNQPAMALYHRFGFVTETVEIVTEGMALVTLALD